MDAAERVTPAYRYRAVPVRVIDGDSYVLRIDLGFRASVDITIRLRGIDTPEIRGASRVMGHAARQAAEALLTAAKVVVVQTHKDEQSFARWLADVWIDGESLADRLTIAGYGVNPQ